MNDTAQQRGGRTFFVWFGVVALFVAAVVSYLADSSPDGLEAVTRQGCETVPTSNGERLTGECIARSGTEHAFAGSPLADYTVLGNSGMTGVAGILGVLVTLLLAGGLFALLREPSRPTSGSSTTAPGDDDSSGTRR
ncbi:cobalt/nickel transport protein [Actinopolyspora xinjiangensis]|uniref:Cobalt/nickel transport protein n=1 Tax=Actinopolyspora xinjiangensis TaxID=405564 RepID=A0A1H0W0R9_9ACTN|nr:PDGLE domain-containing protein [Actinopolyspora xinjiangensis]SDP84125.1 cobalt/nickel transport protein [Actinopolyspora xinjiangensis]